MLYFLFLEKIPSWRTVSHPDYDALQRVLRVLEERETSAVEARARDSRARGLGLHRNQYGDCQGNVWHMCS